MIEELVEKDLLRIEESLLRKELSKADGAKTFYCDMETTKCIEDYLITQFVDENDIKHILENAVETFMITGEDNHFLSLNNELFLNKGYFTFKIRYDRYNRIIIFNGKYIPKEDIK